MILFLFCSLKCVATFWIWKIFSAHLKFSRTCARKSTFHTQNDTDEANFRSTTDKNIFVVIFLARVLYIAENIDYITKTCCNKHGKLKLAESGVWSKYIYKYCVFIWIPVIYYFPYISEILVNKQTISCKKLSFAKNAIFVNRSNLILFIFPSKKNQIALKIYTNTQKSLQNKKITFLENVQKIINLPFKGGGSP